jgi:hypothetical protein
MATAARRPGRVVMQDAVNPYAAPEHLAAIETPAEAGAFYVVAPRKFMLLFFGTAGLYSLYWMYRQWAQFKRATRGSEWPVARALFSVFFVHPLVREIDQSLKRAGSSHAWSPTSLANWIVVLMLVSTVADRMSAREVGSPVTDWLSLVTMVIFAFPMLDVQRAANAAAGDPEGQSNARFTAANIAWTVFGLLLWALLLLGLAAASGWVSLD